MKTYPLTRSGAEALADCIAWLDGLKGCALATEQELLSELVHRGHTALLDALAEDSTMIYAPEDEAANA